MTAWMKSLLVGSDRVYLDRSTSEENDYNDEKLIDDVRT